MHKLINKITFILENTEAIDIPIKNIGQFRLRDVKEHFTSNARFIEKYKTSKLFAIEISKDANVPFKNLANEEELPFDRLLYCPDIVGIEVEYQDGIKEEISVPWGGDSDEINDYQKTFLSEAGNLYIVIHKKLKIKDIFDLERINRETYKIFPKDDLTS